MVKLAVLPAAMPLAVQSTVPDAAPAPGSLQLKFGSGVTDTKVQPPATMSLSSTLLARSGPLFVTAMLKLTSVSGSAVAGPVLRTERSLKGGVPKLTEAELLLGFGSESVV